MRRRLPAVVLLIIACGAEDADDTTAGSSMSGTSQPSSASMDGTDADETTPDEETSEQSTDDPTADATTDPATDPTNDPTGDPTGDPDTTTDGGDPEGGGTIDVTLSGCDIDLGGTVVVSYNGSLGVASVYDDGAYLSGSFQFDQLEVGTIELSSQHRVDTGVVVNLVDTTSTWTNLDGDALGGGTDTISGTLTVETWAPARGQSLLHFDAVTLRNVVDGGLCTVDGTIETTSLYP